MFESSPSQDVLNKLSDGSSGGATDAESIAAQKAQNLAKESMMTLLTTYLQTERPTEWKKKFESASKLAYMIKYMFREDVNIASQKFTKSAESGTESVVKDFAKEAIDIYGSSGLVDQMVLKNTPFMVEPKKLKVVDALIANGADVKAADKQGGTPLHSAASYGNSAMVDALLNAGAGCCTR